MTFSRFLRVASSVSKRLTTRYGRRNPTFVSEAKYSVASAVKGVNADFRVGDEVSGFAVKEIQDVPELHLTAIRLQHVTTGADYMHIAREDSNNVFCVGLRTTPMDSTGVPHILEHTVLCGSNSYPCRDPFFKMLNRSLSTFMNAMTGSDYTIYPFSTQHPKDFYNLMSVYLDAVFKPNLSELDFFQEGWRLEHEDVNDQSSPIVFKGVVFNEMKGVFADSQRLFMQKLQNGLLPSHTYGVVSGGDPLSIPSLTWQQLKDFHAYHYHPSNARFYTYGDLPLAEHLKFINDKYLQGFSKINPGTEVPDEPTWSEPRSNHIVCGLDPMGASDAQSSIAVSYKLASITDPFETFVLQILGELLMGGPNAPFYKSLLEQQLGSSFSPSAGFDSHTRNTTFTMGLQGVRCEDTEKIREIIEETFDKVIEEGFPKERIEAVLHSIELAVKHQTSSFGLGLVMSLTPLWNLDGDPVEALKINKNLEKFKECIQQNPKFLQEKVKQYFKNNSHKYTLTMAPQEGYEKELQEKEIELLKGKIESLTEEDHKRIWEIGNTLTKKQEEEEDISCLPTLKVSDINRNIIPTPVTNINLSGGVPVQICHQPTNGITYFSAVLNTHNIPDHLHSLIPLLCGVLTRMGAGDLDFRQLDQEIELSTGGLHAATHLVKHPIDVAQYEQGILLSSHCLDNNLTRMLDLWTLILNHIRLNDLQRFGTLVKMIATDQANSLVYSGHRYAMTAASSSTSYVAALSEQWSGLTNIRQMKEFSELEDPGEVLEKLQELAQLLLNREQMRVSVNMSPDNHDGAVKTFENFLDNLAGDPSRESSLINFTESYTPHTLRTHHVFPFPVNFASKSYVGVPYAHSDSGALRVLSRLMFRFLHREIREKGGAYGGGAAYSPGGNFSFYSYRDPNSTQTLSTFDAAVEWVLSGGFCERDVEEAKLGVFQAVDAPVAPAAKGKRLFLSHVSEDLFADHRRQILDTTPQDLVRVARNYLRDASIEGACLIGPEKEKIEQDPFWQTARN